MSTEDNHVLPRDPGEHDRHSDPPAFTSSESGRETARAPVAGKVFPLNSSRLTSRYLISIASAMNPPRVPEKRLD